MPSTRVSFCLWPWGSVSKERARVSWGPPPAPEARVEDERDIDADLLRAELRAADATISSTKAELETYKRLYGELLDRVVGGAA